MKNIISINDLKIFFSNITFGTIIQNKIYKQNNNIELDEILPSFKKCKILSIQQQFKYNIAMCEDTVFLTKYYFDLWNIQYKIFFQSIVKYNDYKNGIQNDKTHIFILYKQKNIWYWLQGSCNKFKNNMLKNKNPYILANNILYELEKENKCKCYLRQIFNYPNIPISFIQLYKKLFEENLIN